MSFFRFGSIPVAPCSSGFAVILTLVLSAMTLLAGCGVKAPPQPARFMLPARVQTLRYHFNEDGHLVIHFQAPIKNRLGKPLDDLGGFYIDRSENRLQPGFCPGCPVSYSRRIRLEAKPPEKEKEVWGGTYQFIDKLSSGYVYHYRCFAHDAKGRFDPTQFRTLVIYYDSPSRPSDAVQGKPDDRQVTLSWPPPDRLVDGRPIRDLVGYNIYRRTGEESWTRLNADKPWPLSVFEDRQVINGVTYQYRIRAVRRFHATLIEGASSTVVAVAPADLTPPPPPVNLVGVSTETGVRLRWQPVDAPDLAGYHVYRMAERETRYKRLTRTIVKEATYLDETVGKGQWYHYRLTAVDQAESANESVPGQEISIQFFPVE